MKSFLKAVASCALFLLTTSGAWAFLDVPQGIWYEDAVNQLEQAQMIDSGNFFYPERNLERDELVKMVMIALDELKNYQALSSPTFLDVPLNEWFGPYVERAVELNIITGYLDALGEPTGYFMPANAVTRAEAVQVIIKAFKLTDETGALFSFPDVNEADWFYNAVHIASALGIVEGYSDGTFKPNQPVSRAEMAVMLSRAMELATTLNPSEPPLPEPTPLPTPEPTPTPEPPPATETLFVPNSASIIPQVLDENKTYLAARYYFQGNLEGFYVQKLTVVNDVIGSVVGDDPEGSFAIKKVMLNYPNQEGNLRTAEGVLLANGTVTFSDLEFFAPKNEPTPLEIYVETNSFSSIGAQLSGETIRLGVQEVNNNGETFRAIGQYSNTLFEGDSNFPSKENDLMVVRKGGPLLLSTAALNETLSNGALPLIQLNLRSEGFAGLGRLVFRVSVNDADQANLMLNNFKLRQNGNLVEEAVIYDATGGQNLNVGSLTDGTSLVIVSFDQEQVISTNETTFTLEAEASGVATDDQVSVQLVADLNPLTGLTAENQENTGKVYVNGDASAGLFTGANDFSQLAAPDHNLIWSDRSGGPHSYPNVSGGNVTDNSGSPDWSNGVWLDMSEVKTQFLKR